MGEVKRPKFGGRQKGSGAQIKVGAREGRQYPSRIVGMDDARWAKCLAKPGGASAYLRGLVDTDVSRVESETG